MVEHDNKLKPGDPSQVNVLMETRVFAERPRLFLVAKRDISPNEILYWDYGIVGHDESQNYNYFRYTKDLKSVVIIDSAKKLN